MIAVEWNDWEAPRDASHKVYLRQGVLLQMSPTTRDPVNIAFVLTKCMPHDQKHRAKVGDTIIMAVKMEQITAKGVSLPFEP